MEELAQWTKINESDCRAALEPGVGPAADRWVHSPCDVISRNAAIDALCDVAGRKTAVSALFVTSSVKKRCLNALCDLTGPCNLLNVIGENTMG